MKDSDFVISKTSGEIAGNTLTSELANEVKVINPGSSDYSFKSIVLFDGNVQVIEVQEFRTSLEKPFIALSMGGAGLVTGMCR